MSTLNLQRATIRTWQAAGYLLDQLEEHSAPLPCQCEECQEARGTLFIFRQALLHLEMLLGQHDAIDRARCRFMRKLDEAFIYRGPVEFNGEFSNN